MMGLEAVVSDIQEKGRREAGAIRKETQEEVDEILKGAQRRVEALKLSAERDVQAQVARMMAQEDSAANLIVKRQVLNAQKEMLDQVYSATLKSLSELQIEVHKRILSNLLLMAAGDVKVGIVSSNARDAPLVKELIARDPHLSKFRFKDIVETEGGIVVENEEGTMKVDLSYRTFLDKIWEVGLKDAADILFA